MRRKAEQLGFALQTTLRTDPSAQLELGDTYLSELNTTGIVQTKCSFESPVYEWGLLKTGETYEGDLDA